MTTNYSPSKATGWFGLLFNRIMNENSLVKDFTSDHDAVQKQKKPAPVPRKLFKNLNITTSESDNHPIWIISPIHREANKAILYIPGYHQNETITSQHWHYIQVLVEQTGANVVVPCYPVLEDGDICVPIEFLTDVYVNFFQGMISRDIYMIGDYTGGELAFALAIHLNRVNTRHPDKVILVSPTVDMLKSQGLNDSIKLSDEKGPHDENRTVRQSAGEIRNCKGSGSLNYQDFDQSPCEISLIAGSEDLTEPEIGIWMEKMETYGFKAKNINFNGSFRECLSKSASITSADSVQKITEIINNEIPALQMQHETVSKS